MKNIYKTLLLLSTSLLLCSCQFSVSQSGSFSSETNNGSSSSNGGSSSSSSLVNKEITV